MTVSYMEFTHTANAIGVFLKVLRIWKGSLLKGVWKDLTLFITLYTFISLLYRLCLWYDDDHRHHFEVLCCYCAKFSVRIPLSFLLGFYVTQVVSRWWEQWNALAWPDDLALNLNLYCEDRSTRRTIVRWGCLSNILVLRHLSIKVAKRFPSLEHLIEAQLLTEKERDMLDSLLKKTDGRHDLSWAPIHWAQGAIHQARQANIITGDVFLWNIHGCLTQIAKQNWKLYCYGWISIPIVYTQLVTVAVTSYFCAALFSRQYLHPQNYIHLDGVLIKADKYVPGVTFNLVGYDDSIHDMYIPVFTILEFLFYFGWMKVAESLINPFGEDDDDFETNYIIDRNLKIGFMMVERDVVEPESTFDEFAHPPNMLPHTAGSAEFKDIGPQMPTDNFVMEDKQAVQIDFDDGEKSLFDNDETSQLTFNPKESMKSRANSLRKRKPSVNSTNNRVRAAFLHPDGLQGSPRLSRANSARSARSVISKTGSIISNRLQAVLESSEEKDGQINAASTILKDENISSERDAENDAD